MYFFKFTQYVLTIHPLDIIHSFAKKLDNNIFFKKQIQMRNISHCKNCFLILFFVQKLIISNNFDIQEVIRNIFINSN